MFIPVGDNNDLILSLLSLNDGWQSRVKTAELAKVRDASEHVVAIKVCVFLTHAFIHTLNICHLYGL